MRHYTCVGAVVLAMGLAGCAENGQIVPGDRDLPRPRGMSPSVAEEAAAQAEGTRLTSQEARARVDEFDISSDNLDARQWPVDTISYKALQNPAERAVYLRRALGRYALTQANERGLGTSLSGVRRVARIAAPSTAGEWWTRSTHGGDLQSGERNRRVTLPDTINATVKNSYQIASFGDLPAIRGTAIQEAKGRFVPEFFADLSVEHREDWVTNPALAGGADRAITDETDAEFGVRSRLRTGGELSVSQRFTATDTNRTAYIPGEQTFSETAVTYVQPLLRDGGMTYNDIPRRIANMDTQVAVEEFHRQASAHLLEVERAYWNLYVARAVYLQKRHIAGHGAQIAGQMSGRSEIDADPVVVSRARAQAARWKADTVRAKAAVDNAEFRLAALVNDPRYGPAGVELLPGSAPNGALMLLSQDDTISAVLQNRPEVQQAILQYEAALLREGAAANQSLPELDLVLEARATGGSDGRDAGAAFRDARNGFGSLVGLKFAVPLGFDERDARYHRRRLETVQQERQVLSAISSVLLEVDVAANEYIVACNDLVAQRQALNAVQSDIRVLENRWDQGVGETGIDFLQALLSGYDALQATEQAVVQARATREVAAANLARARGVLLQRWGLQMNLQPDVRGEQTYKLLPTGVRK